jgi:hypothetical protein
VALWATGAVSSAPIPTGGAGPPRPRRPDLERHATMQWFWYLVEDFSEQSLVMKAFLAWGWLSIVIMIAGMVNTALG